MKSFSFSLIDKVFVLVISLLIIVSYLSYQRLNGLLAATDLVNKSNTITLKTEQAFSYLKDAQLGQRGYLLTKDSAYLAPYWGSFEKSNTLFNEIIEITSTDSVQQEKVRNLQTLISVRYDLLNIMIRMSDSTKQQYSLSSQLRLSKKSMDEIRVRIAEIFKLENTQLAKRVQEQNHYASISPLFLVGLSCFTLIVIVIGFLKIKLDTNHLKNLIENLRLRDVELNKKNAELENTNIELSSFSYVASHDLKEPLRKIQLYTERISEREIDNLSETGKYDFERIVSAVSRMQNLFDALLSFSNANTTKNEMFKTDLNNTLLEVKIDLQDAIDEKNVTIESVNLPELNVVPVQFHQLFLNILSNAIKYSKSDVASVVKITAKRVETVKNNRAGWELIFSDNGIGFKQEFEDKIFQLFQRLHEKSEYNGTGIGLAICKKIMSNHQGKITAKGEVGVGSTFTIFIPDYLI